MKQELQSLSAKLRRFERTLGKAFPPQQMKPKGPPPIAPGLQHYGMLHPTPDMMSPQQPPVPEEEKPKLDNDHVRTRMKLLVQRMLDGGMEPDEKKRMQAALPELIQQMRDAKADPKIIGQLTGLMQHAGEPDKPMAPEDKYPHIQ